MQSIQRTSNHPFTPSGTSGAAGAHVARTQSRQAAARLQRAAGQSDDNDGDSAAQRAAERGRAAPRATGSPATAAAPPSTTPLVAPAGADVIARAHQLLRFSTAL